MKTKYKLSEMEFMIFSFQPLQQWTIFTMNSIFENISHPKRFRSFIVLCSSLVFLIVYAEAVSNSLFFLALFVKEENFIFWLSVSFLFFLKWKCLTRLLIFHAKKLYLILPLCKHKLRTLKIKVLNTLSNKWAPSLIGLV